MCDQQNRIEGAIATLKKQMSYVAVSTTMVAHIQYTDIIMGAMAYQFTSLSIVHSTV